eukprot:SAG31_NODE_479_length_15133_cov_39.816283_6_plen_69_part_00
MWERLVPETWRSVLLRATDEELAALPVGRVPTAWYATNFIAMALTDLGAANQATGLAQLYSNRTESTA